jgi:hypothetical protein
MSFLKMAGLAPQLAIDDHTVQARLHQGAGGTILWATNPTHTTKTVTITLASAAAGFESAEDLWGGQAIAHDGARFTMSVPARDAVVARLL